MRVVLNNREWKNFLQSNPDLLDSLWDLVPKEMDLKDIEQIVWTDKKLYHLSYKGRVWAAWIEHIEEFIPPTIGLI